MVYSCASKYGYIFFPKKQKLFEQMRFASYQFLSIYSLDYDFCFNVPVISRFLQGYLILIWCTLSPNNDKMLFSLSAWDYAPSSL